MKQALQEDRVAAPAAQRTGIDVAAVQQIIQKTRTEARGINGGKSAAHSGDQLIPPRVERYVHRTTELARVSPSGTTISVRVLLGDRGMGKSQLVVHYVQERMRTRPNISVLWVDPDRLDITVAELRVRLGLSCVENETVEALARRVRGAIENLTAPWILVLDGFTSGDDAIEALVPQSCRGAGGEVIITTGNPAIGRRYSDGKVDIGPMSDDEVIDLLCEERDAYPGAMHALDAIAKHLAHQPLALGIAARLRYDDEAMPDFEDRLKHLVSPLRLEDDLAMDQTFADLWNMAVGHDDQQRLLASTIAQCGSGPIPVQLLPHFANPMVQSDALSALEERGLIAVTRNADGEAQVVRMHRTLARCGRYLVDCDSTFGDDVNGTLCRSAAVWLTTEGEVCVALDALHHLNRVAPRFPGLLRVLALILRSVPFRDAPLDVHRSLWMRTELAIMANPDHPDALTARANLASGYWAAGRVIQALSLLEQVVADRVRILGTDHPYTLTTRANLATSYQSAGRHNEAVVLMEQVLVDHERILGADHPNTMTTRSNLAMMYQSAGRYPEAFSLNERVLTDHIRLFGDNHPDTVSSRESLAAVMRSINETYANLVYRSPARMEETLVVLTHLLAQLERILGESHPDTLSTRSNLAAAYLTAGRPSEAIALSQQVLAQHEKVHGEENLDTLATRSNLAAAYLAAGRTSDAVELNQAIVTSYERIVGLDDPDTLTSLSNLASSYQAIGRISDAIEMNEKVLHVRCAVLGSDHPETLTTRANLATCLWASDRGDEAIGLLEAVLAARDEVLGLEHPDTLTTRANLATCYWSTSRFADAISVNEQVLADLSRVLGKDHPDTLNTRANLATCLWSAGRTAEAIEQTEGVLSDLERTLGVDHPDTCTTRVNLEVLRQSVDDLTGPFEQPPVEPKLRNDAVIHFPSRARLER